MCVCYALIGALQFCFSSGRRVLLLLVINAAVPFFLFYLFYLFIFVLSLSSDSYRGSVFNYIHAVKPSVGLCSSGLTL